MVLKKSNPLAGIKSRKGKTPCSPTTAATCHLILEDLLIRLDEERKGREEIAKSLVQVTEKLDTRLDIIEKEIASVKKVISFITWIFKIAPFLMGLWATFHKNLHLELLSNLIPKGRGNGKRLSKAECVR